MLNKIIEMCELEGVELNIADGALEVFFDDYPSDELLALLKGHKDQLKDFMLDQQTNTRFGQTAAIELVDRTRPLQLSFAQQRLWLLDQFNAGSPEYNMPSALHFAGEFDEDIAERAFDTIIQRHEPLRTVFVAGDVEPYQQVLADAAFTLTRVDISLSSGYANADEQQNAITGAMKAAIAQPFDLASDLMLRATCYRQSAQHGVLFFNMHHIASDGWSVGVMIKEFIALYQAYASGQANPLAELAVQYADYAAWQRRWLQGEVLDRQLDYWINQLADCPPIHHFPLDYPRPVNDDYSGQNVQFELSTDLTANINQLARAHKVTLFMLLQGAFSLLLSRYCGETDIVIGTPIANRRQQALEPMVGFFANTLILRSDCAANQSFVDYLEQIKQTNLAAQANQDIPFELLVENLNPPRSQSYAPLFQIMFAMDNTQGSQIAMDKVNLKTVQFDQVSAKYDFTLNVLEVDGVLKFRCEFKTSLFKADTMLRMGQHLSHLLSAIVAAPGTAIGSLPLLSDEQTRQKMKRLHREEKILTGPLTLHQLLEQQVAQQPDHTALVFGQQSLSYFELNTRANQLANHLLATGVGRGALVGISIERSLAMVVALFGVLKAGAAYVPLEPGYPQSRLDYMAEDAGLKQVITQASLVDTFGQLSPLVIDDATTGLQLGELDGDNIANQANADANNMAYVIYTSGSTGQPKGVKVSHRNAAHFIAAMDSELSADAQGVWLAISGLAFDISVLEIFGALSAGFKVVIAPEQRKSAAIGELIEQHHVSHMQCTPSHISLLLADKQNHRGLAQLSKLLLGGETLAPHVVVELRQHSQADIINVYGPTEATVWATKYIVSRHDGDIPIGKPLTNYQAYVVNQSMQIQPIGVAGELLIGGPGVAQGYLNQAALSFERFIDNPFEGAAKGDARLYRTGDLARYMADGNLAYVGRNDNQVKLRGFRIELGEIETQLLACEEIKAAVVQVTSDNSQIQQLVAYVIVEDQFSGQGVQLQSHFKAALAQMLPEYMIPGIFMFLDLFPQTPNGKLDVQALPQPQSSVDISDYSEPETDTEQQLAQIWSTLLKVDVGMIGQRANFFDMGGHSLLLMRLVGEIKTRFAVELQIRDIFELSTLSAIAGAVDEALIKLGFEPLLGDDDGKEEILI